MIKYIRNGEQCYNIAHIAYYEIRDIGGNMNAIIAYPHLAPQMATSNHGMYLLTTPYSQKANEAYNAILEFLDTDKMGVLDVTPFQYNAYSALRSAANPPNPRT